MNQETLTNQTCNQMDYDLNYRLKRKFQQMHDDYWLIVQFFKRFEQNFAFRSTDNTITALSLAKSQITNNLSLVNLKCHYCLRTAEDTKIREISACNDCLKEIGMNI